MTAVTTISAPPAVVSPARWPLFIAPVVALIYYLAMCKGFQTAIADVVFDARDLDITLDAAPTKWGTHWIYHLFAETASVGFGTFVAAGIARDRAAMSGLIGGFGISLGWTAVLSIILFGHFYLPGFDEQIIDPWYQYLIGGCLAILAPIMGYLIGGATREAMHDELALFAGIPRAHFLWLWVPAYWYAAAMIGPILKIWLNGLIEWVSPLTDCGGLSDTAGLLFLGVGRRSDLAFTRERNKTTDFEAGFRRCGTRCWLVDCCWGPSWNYVIRQLALGSDSAWRSMLIKFVACRQGVAADETRQ